MARILIIDDSPSQLYGMQKIVEKLGHETILTEDERTAHIPINIVTTKKLETDRVWGLRQGAKEYLVKPVTEKALKDVLTKHLP